jgi:hypothetical protein
VSSFTKRDLVVIKVLSILQNQLEEMRQICINLKSNQAISNQAINNESIKSSKQFKQYHLQPSNPSNSRAHKQAMKQAIDSSKSTK